MGGKKGEIYLEYMEQASFHDFIHFMLDEYRECDDIFRSLTRQFLRERDFFENASISRLMIWNAAGRTIMRTMAILARSMIYTAMTL